MTKQEADKEAHGGREMTDLDELKRACKGCDALLVPTKKLLALSERLERAESELATLSEAYVNRVLRISELEAALKPFAKAGKLFSEITWLPVGSQDDARIYSPAAGDEYCLTGRHLRTASRALGGKDD